MSHNCQPKTNALKSNHNCKQRHKKQENMKEIYVHELVAKAFVPNPNNYPYVEHIDGDRTNNHANNLRWTENRPRGHPYRSSCI